MFTLLSVVLLPQYGWHGRICTGTGRLATELNLSRIQEPFADERQERESHNRTRMWLLCFVMDRCLSIHLGRAWMVQEDSVCTYDILNLRVLSPWTKYSAIMFLHSAQMIRNVASWLHNFKYHNQCDGYLTSLTEVLIIMSRFVGMVNPAFGTSSVESVNVRTWISLIHYFLSAPNTGPGSCFRVIQDIDFAALYKTFNNELMVYKDVIDERHRGDQKSSGLYPTLYICCYRLAHAPLSFVVTDPSTVVKITIIYW